MHRSDAIWLFPFIQMTTSTRRHVVAFQAFHNCQMMMLLLLLLRTLAVVVSFLSRMATSSEMEQQHRQLIIGGHDAPPNQYPYFATFDHFGGGILIAPDIVLTAGHVNPPLEQHVQVRLNHSNFQSTYFGLDPLDDETFGIAAISQHPEYYTISWDENVNDFNIIRLDGFSKVTPVRLNRNHNIPEPGQMVSVVGMGSMDPDPAKFFETSATTLQEVELEALSQEQCLQQSGHDPARPGLTYQGRLFGEQMVCTSGGPNNEKDACAFDSGSPLIIQQEHHHHHHKLYPVVVGLVSWGENCADPYFPAVNARVSYAMDWIDATVCKLSKADPSLLTDFRCDSQGYSWKYAQMFSTSQRKDLYHSTGGGAASGTHAILALVVAAGVGLVAIAWRSTHEQHHPRRHSMRLSTRSTSIDDRFLSMHPSKAAKERNPVSPEESVKTYDTFAGQSV